MPDLVVIGLIAALLALLLWAGIQNEPEYGFDRRTAQATEQQQKPSEETLFTLFGYRVLAPGKYQHDCANPRDTDEADLCEQVRMADAAGKTVHWLRWQYVAALLGIGLLFLTFWEAKRTADAAMEAAESARQSTAESKRSADAAEQAAALARQNFERTERPYLFVFDVLYGKNPTEIGYDVGNFGQTPAMIEDACVAFALSYDGVPPEPLPVPPGHRLRLSDHVRPGAGNQVNNIGHRYPEDASVRTNRGLMVTVPDRAELFFRVVIHYRGPFSRNHETSGLWRFDSDASCFVRHGGEAYNYVR